MDIREWERVCVCVWECVYVQAYYGVYLHVCRFMSVCVYEGYECKRMQRCVCMCA